MAEARNRKRDGTKGTNSKASAFKQNVPLFSDRKAEDARPSVNSRTNRTVRKPPAASPSHDLSLTVKDKVMPAVRPKRNHLASDKAPSQEKDPENVSRVSRSPNARPKRVSPKAGSVSSRKSADGVGVELKAGQNTYREETVHKHSANKSSYTRSSDTRPKSDSSSGKPPKNTVRSGTRASEKTRAENSKMSDRSANEDNAQTDSGLIIIIMNANGAGKTKPEDRRKGIAHTVNSLRPKLVLFQEFLWKGISGKIWENTPLPSHYQYFGNYEASVLYDVRDIHAMELNSTDLRRILEQLQRTSNNAFGTPFPMDFDPLPRMCASLISSVGVPFGEFICVSWHGPWTTYTLERRKSYFQYFLEFLRNIKMKFKKPLLVAGDFNVDFHDIVAFIKSPFKKYLYSPSKRREGVIKDYFITTEDMDLNNLDFVDTGEFESCFDHDPVSSCLCAIGPWSP